MKKSGIVALCALTLALAFVFCSCDSFVEGLVSELENIVSSIDAEGSTEVAAEQTAAATETTASENAIPFRNRPEIKKYSLPAEEFADELEREASQIIDEAIERAVSCVIAMKDDRHSTDFSPFDIDANEKYAALDENEKQLLHKIVDGARSGKTVTVGADEFGGDLKSAFFDVSSALEYAYPDVKSYLFIDGHFSVNMNYETNVTSVWGEFFDPYFDENRSLSKGEVSMSDVAYAAALLDRVVGRIIRFMPDGLSTYDKYYYLAEVICEKNDYDDRPKNCYTAFGALIGGRSVCEGYSRAFYLLCKEAGLWCDYRSGNGHIWNMVMIDGNLYNVDVTWCDGKEAASYRWYDNFVKSDEHFADNGHSPIGGRQSTGGDVPSPYEE